MKKMIAFLLLLAAPLMAQHATQFAYYSTTSSQFIQKPSPDSSASGDEVGAGPSITFFPVQWDSDTVVQTEGFTLQSSRSLPSAPLDTILIHHAGWYLAKFSLAGGPDVRFGLLNLDENAIIPFSVYGSDFDFGVFKEFSGQVVFYVPANTRIQLINDGENFNLNKFAGSLSSIYLFELSGR